MSDLSGVWHIWFVTVVIIVAAIIDGWKLKVPNWLTMPFILSGWVYSVVTGASAGGWSGGLLGLWWSLAGTVVGMLLLLPANLRGAMGEGDVKMLMGIGAWVHTITTLYAFAYGTIIGGIIAVAMIWLSGEWRKHYAQFWSLVHEQLTETDSEKLYNAGQERKKSMALLPYGIPLTIGTIAYFAWSGMYMSAS